MVTIDTIRLVGRETGIGALVHRFRSSFRDWPVELTNTPHAVLEAALAHTVRDATKRSLCAFRSVRIRSGLGTYRAALAAGLGQEQLLP